MKPEQRIDQQTWEILLDIKEEQLAQGNRQIVKYRITNTELGRNIPQTRIKDMLSSLEQQEVFKFHRNSRGTRFGTGEIFYLVIDQKRFDEVYEKYNSLATDNDKKLVQLTLNDSYDPRLPAGWELIQDVKKPQIKKDGEIVYEFATNWSDKYRYFECLWNNYGNKVGPGELFEYKSKEQYPEKGKVASINKAIGDKLVKLFNETKFKQLPIRFERNNGYTLVIDEVASN